AEALVAEAREKVAESQPSVSITTVIEQSDPRQLLLRLAENAELVVMGSRGRGRFKSLFLGSVASGVAGQASCPVVVIPARDHTGAEPPLADAGSSGRADGLGPHGTGGGPPGRVAVEARGGPARLRPTGGGAGLRDRVAARSHPAARTVRCRVRRCPRADGH